MVHKRLYVDDMLDKKDVSCVYTAARRWRESTGGLADINIVSVLDGSTKFPLVTSVDDVVVRKYTSQSIVVSIMERSYGGILYGYYDDRGHYSEISLVSDRYVNDAQCISVMMHEIGHAMGLVHSETKGTLMFNMVEEMAADITKSDLIEFCRVFKCVIELSDR